MCVCMYVQLMSDMDKHGFPGLDELERRWKEDYRDRLAITGFLKDKVWPLARFFVACVCVWVACAGRCRVFTHTQACCACEE